MKLAGNVRNGTLLLDSTHPGWYNKVDLNSLKMNVCSRCVLGQLYEGYTKGLYELGLGGMYDVASKDHLVICSFGFDVPVGGGIRERAREFEILRKLWVTAIKKRRTDDANIQEQEYCFIGAA